MALFPVGNMPALHAEVVYARNQTYPYPPSLHNYINSNNNYFMICLSIVIITLTEFTYLV